MSIMRLRKTFRKKVQVSFGKKKVNLGSFMEWAFWLIVIIFLVGAFYTFGGPSSRNAGARGAQSRAPVRNVTPVVATVIGEKISREDFDKLYVPRAANVSQADLLMQDRYLKKDILDGMEQRILMLDAAKKAGVEATKDDINKKIEQMVEDNVTQMTANRRAAAARLRKRKQTLEQYKDELRGKLNKSRKDMEEAVIFENLEKSVKDQVRISDKDLEDSYLRCKARHILIMPDRLKADAAKKLPKGAKPEQTPAKDYKAEAKRIAEDITKRLRAHEDFAKLAKEFSNDTSSAVRGGLLSGQPAPATKPGEKPKESDYFDPGQMVPEFRKACLTLPLNQISDPVETNYGFHVVQVLDRRPELPKDFAQKKEDYRKTLLETRKGEVWKEYSENLKKTATIDVEDPELKAYQLLDEDKKAEAAPLLDQAVKGDATNVGAKYQLAMLLSETTQKAQAIALLSELSENEHASACPQVHMKLGELYLGEKKNKEAIDAFKAAADWAQTFDYQSMFIHQDVKAKFEQLGAKDLAAIQKKWLDDYNANQQQNGMGGMGGMPITIPPAGKSG